MARRPQEGETIRTPRSTRRRGAVVAAVLAVVLALQGPSAPSPATAQTTAGPASAGPFTFATGPYAIRDLPEALLPYNDPTLVPSCGLTDGDGVAKHRDGSGRLVDHPVAQAQCALNMLRNYRIDPNPSYLAQSVANAERLIDRADAHRGGIFFPYPFAWHNPGRATMRPPWYSSMAQGLALSVFTRLGRVTGEPRWRQAAQGTFASYKVNRAMGGPWHVTVENGLLVLDEYPTVPADRVFNGHNFSLNGLYDHWQETGSTEALAMIRGAIHTSYVSAATRIRVPGGISNYCASDACIANKVRNPNYHPVHIGQLTHLFNLTGHWHFGSLAEAFTADSPRRSTGRASLAAGTHRGYTFDADGNGSATATATLGATTAFAYDRREVPGGRCCPGNGVWLRIAEGPLAGRWVKESPRAVPLGIRDRIPFAWNRSVRVAAGTYTAHAYDADGAVTATVSGSTGGGAWAYNAVARANGRLAVLLADGPLAGHWLTLDARTTRDTSFYTDVDGSIFRGDIIWLTDQGITRGCSEHRYCPGSGVTREQMASFLVRALRLPATNRDFFTDDEGSQHEGDVNRLAAAGITGGCAERRFCPRAGVTRAEMASFLVRALGLPSTSSDPFVDDEGNMHEGAINRLAAADITGGCADRRFCPTAGVTRGQMAAFLHRALPSGGTTAAASVDESATPSPSATPSAASTPSPTPEPTGTMTPEPSPTPTATPEPTASPTPSESSTPAESTSDEPLPTPPASAAPSGDGP